jgi:hypothetical protein
MNWKEFGRGCGLRYDPVIYLEGLRKTHINFSQDSWCLS